MLLKSKYIAIVFFLILTLTFAACTIDNEKKTVNNPVKIAVLDVAPSTLSAEFANVVFNPKEYCSVEKSHSDDICAIVYQLPKENTIIDLYVVGRNDIEAELVKEALNAIIGEQREYDAVNMSFYLKQWDNEIDALLRKLYLDGTVLIASAGNNARPYSEFPADSPYVISVAGVQDCGLLWKDSNYKRVDFAKPAVMKSLIDGEKLEGTSVSAALLTVDVGMIKIHGNYSQVKSVKQFLINSVDTKNAESGESIGYGIPKVPYE